MKLCVKCIYSEPDPSYTAANLLQIQISLGTACSLISLNAMVELVSCDLGACSTLKSCFCSRSNYFPIKSKKLSYKVYQVLPTYRPCSLQPKPSVLGSVVAQESHPQAHSQSHYGPGWSISATLMVSFPLASWLKESNNIMFSDAADVSKSSSTRRLPCYLN